MGGVTSTAIVLCERGGGPRALGAGAQEPEAGHRLHVAPPRLRGASPLPHPLLFGLRAKEEGWGVGDVFLSTFVSMCVWVVFV